MAQPGWTSVETGIRKNRYGYEVRISSFGKPINYTFPLTATLEEMRQWRVDAKRDRELERRLKPIPKPSAVPFNRERWCYIYFVRAGSLIKIGRAVDVAERLRNMRPGHPDELQLLAVVPAHAQLEGALHRFFAAYRHRGEWFHVNDTLLGWIEAMRDGINPIWLLFEPDRLDQYTTLSIQREENLRSRTIRKVAEHVTRRHAEKAVQQLLATMQHE